jgi:hypothetical protein
VVKNKNPCACSTAAPSPRPFLMPKIAMPFKQDILMRGIWLQPDRFSPILDR